MTPKITSTAYASVGDATKHDMDVFTCIRGIHGGSDLAPYSPKHHIGWTCINYMYVSSTHFTAWSKKDPFWNQAGTLLTTSRPSHPNDCGTPLFYSCFLLMIYYLDIGNHSCSRLAKGIPDLWNTPQYINIQCLLARSQMREQSYEICLKVSWRYVAIVRLNT